MSKVQKKYVSYPDNRIYAIFYNSVKTLYYNLQFSSKVKIYIFNK